jgi:hypothetical protein
MNTTNIARNFSLIALSSLALAAGSAQADNWGGHYNPYLQITVPVVPQHDDHHDFGNRFERDITPRHDGFASIDLRQQQQMERIRDGMASGQISRHEARDLLREQREIERAQRYYLADGRLSRDEWLDLNRRLDQSANNIRAEKHDGNWR